MFKRSRNKAQSIVEFAIVMPVFVALLALLIDASQLSYAKGATYYGAYSGARAASVAQGSGYSQAEAAAMANMKPVLDTSPKPIGFSGGGGKGSLLTVTANMQVHLFIPLPNANMQFNGSPVVSTSMTMMKENN